MVTVCTFVLLCWRWSDNMKVIYVESCENCPNVRKRAIYDYCVLNGAQNPLALDYKIPTWCPLDEVKA